MSSFQSRLQNFDILDRTFAIYVLSFKIKSLYGSSTVVNAVVVTVLLLRGLVLPGLRVQSSKCIRSTQLLPLRCHRRSYQLSSKNDLDGEHIVLVYFQVLL